MTIKSWQVICYTGLTQRRCECTNNSDLKKISEEEPNNRKIMSKIKKKAQA